jgi:hypothetical protein
MARARTTLTVSPDVADRVREVRDEQNNYQNTTEALRALLKQATEE